MAVHKGFGLWWTAMVGYTSCAHRLTGMKPRKRGDKWVYPKLAAVLAKAGLKPLGYYLSLIHI